MLREDQAIDSSMKVIKVIKERKFWSEPETGKTDIEVEILVKLCEGKEVAPIGKFS